MKATALAPANIAFIKYWGKADLPAQAGETLRLPLNSSLSMNLSAAYTTTTVEFSPEYNRDRVYFLSDTLDKIPLKRDFVKITGFEEKRIIEHLNRIREHSNIANKAKVVTQNSFPKGTGAASSASGFAALTVAGFAAAGMILNEKELTIVARIGSGSACRSIPDGFVIWEKDYAYSIYPHSYWDLRDILVIVDSRMKKVSTTEGMEKVKTSPFLSERLSNVEKRLVQMKTALEKKNFTLLGGLIEEDCLDMHHVMQTQNPPLFYWNDETKEIMEAAKTWRKKGLQVYFTIDAGPNVHLLCEAKDEQTVLNKVKTLNGVESIIVNAPAPGAHIVDDDLF